MPLALDPTRTFDVCLNTDADKPAKQRPIFTFRYLTGRQSEAIRDCLDSMKGDFWHAAKRLRAEIARSLAGWSNMPIPFDPANLADVVNDLELCELAGKIQGAMRLDGTDLKKSESPSPSEPDSSASIAA